MRLLEAVFGKNYRREALLVAKILWAEYREGVDGGCFRLDDWFLQRLKMFMANERAIDVHTHFLRNRSRSLPEAEAVLVAEIAINIELSLREEAQFPAIYIDRRDGGSGGKIANAIRGLLKEKGKSYVMLLSSM